MDKGKQKACDAEAPSQSASFHNKEAMVLGEASSSRAPEPMDIPARANNSQRADSDNSRSPSSCNDHRGRHSHARAKSSLGSANMYDFFGPSSLTSNSTDATSFHFGSPEASPRPGKSSQIQVGTVDAVQRDTLEDTIEAGHSRFVSASEEPTQNEANAQATEEEDAAEPRHDTSATPMSPLYPEETLPHYEEAPQYTPPLSHQSGSTFRSKTSAFRAAAANRFLSGRIAKKLNLPPALQSRLRGTQTPDASSSSQGPYATAHYQSRVPFVRSDSAPNLTQSQGRRRIEVRNYTATAYVDGARMGPAPRPPGPASSRPSTAGAADSSDRTAMAPRIRPSTSAGATTEGQWHSNASPLLRTAMSSSSSSRRNSGESRPPSRGTVSSAPNSGLFTCGYSSSRSGATTPTRPSLLRKGRSRTVNLRSLGDIFSINRDRDSSSASPATPSEEVHQQDTEEAGESATSRTVLREVISPISNETLISARVHSHSTARPTLMNAARSSPQAGVDAAASGNPVLINPRQSIERKPDPMQKLPREIILSIFKNLIDLHVQEHHVAVKKGIWRGQKSSETRYVGAEAAFRELARLSRVSRKWQSYVLDGQLWQHLEFSKYPDMAEEAMISIAKAVGPFVRRLDLHGHAGLRSSVLLPLSKAQRPRSLTEYELQGATSTSTSVPFAACQLEELDLEGCRQISTSALNMVLSRCPNLKKVNLGSLPCVDNTTLCMLAATATHLDYLDISRCRGVDGEGIRAIFTIQQGENNISAVLKERNMVSRFREFHAAGVAGLDKETLAQLGRHWPNLEVLDISYCSDVNDAAIAALVSSEGDVVSEKGGFVTLTPRQAGSQGDDEVVRRAFPHLRSLNLSSCRALTDRTCMSLSHAVPQLEVLEMANIGAGLKDAGLVKLFATVPQLRKLDLERATQITDAVLSALTPPESHAEAFGHAVPDRDTLMNGTRPRGSLLGISRRSANRRRQPSSTPEDATPPSYDQEAVSALIPATGTHLTHLILSSANHLTAEVMLLLINRCPHLMHLEVDDTHADNEVAMQFVQLARYRKVRNAYLSLVDCRSFSRDTYSSLTHADGGESAIRPRRGSRGFAFRGFSYDDAEPSSAVLGLRKGTEQNNTSLMVPSSSGSLRTSLDGRERGHDECNDLKPVLKSFWGWQSVDARLKQKKKAEQRAITHLRRQGGGRGKVSSAVAMAFRRPIATASGGFGDGFERGTNAGQQTRGARWSRAIVPERSAGDGGVETDEDEDEDDGNDDDARGCSVM